MKKLFVRCVLSLVVLSLMTALRADNWVDVDTGITWNYVVTSGVSTVIGITNSASVSNLAVPDSLGGFPVARIGEDAFNGLELTNVILSAGVKSIGAKAFYCCSKLLSANFPEGLVSIEDDAFYNCKLSTVKLPSTIKTVGDEAFYCTSQSDAYYSWGTIGSVIITNVTDLTIGSRAFYGNKVGQVWISGKNVNIGPCAFQQSMYVGYEGYTTSNNYDIKLTGEDIKVGNYAFDGLQHRQGRSVLDLTGVSYLGLYAFREYGLYYRTSSSSWYELGTADICISSQLKHADPTAFYRADLGYIYLDTLDALWSVDSLSGFAGNVFGCYWHYLKVDDSIVQNVTIPDSITEIPAYAFAYTHLGEITIPNGVTSIGSNAFDNCYAAVISVPDTVSSVGKQAFYANSITNLHWPSSATVIPDEVCGSCKNLSHVDIPEGIVSIGGSAFSGAALTSINLPSTLRSIGGSALNGTKLTDVAIPEGVTNIGSYAFESCTALQSISLPTTLKVLGGGSFYKCSNLKSIIVPDLAAWCGVDVSASSDYLHLFYKSKTFCIKGEPVNDLAIPDGVTRIGTYAFAYCTNITTVTIPASVREIGKGAFDSCSRIRSFEVASDNPYFESIDGILYARSSILPLYVPASTTDLRIRDGVEIVNSSVILGLSSLTNVYIPASVTSIVVSAFANCRSSLHLELSSDNRNFLKEGGLLYSADGKTLLMADGDITNICFRATTEAIGEYAFMKCKNLTELVIPESVTEIGRYAIDGCSALVSLIIPNSINSLDTLCSNGGCSALESLTVPFIGACRGKTWWTNGNMLDGPFGYAEAKRLKRLVVTDDTLFVSGALSSCTSLESLTLPFIGATCDDTTNDYFGYLFGATSYEENGTKVPTTLTSVTILGGSMVAEDAFNGCAGIESVILKAPMRTIDFGAFYDCTKLAHVELPEGLLTIGGEAFCECSALASINIPESVTYVGSMAFAGTSLPQTSGCYYVDHCLLGGYNNGCNVKMTSLPDKARLISVSCFSYNQTLKNLVIPASVKYIGSCAFADSQITNVVFLGGDISIGSSAFKTRYSGGTPPPIRHVATESMADWCSLSFDYSSANPLNLGTVGFSAGGKEIGKTLNIPDGVAQINSYAFYQLPVVETVDIAESVTNLCGYAFEGCKSITTMHFRSMTAPKVDVSALLDVGTNCTVFVPRGSTGWNALQSCKVRQITTSGSTTRTASPRFNIVEYGAACAVQFDVNGGDATVEPIELNENINYGELPTPVRAGYRFDGWYTAAEGGERIMPETLVPADPKLYAHWTSEIPFLTDLEKVAIGYPTKITFRYTLGSCVNTENFGLAVFAVVDGGTNRLTTAEGDVSLTAGTHEMTIDLAPFVDSLIDHEINLRVSVVPRSDYLVIDLAEGPSATRYPLEFLDEAPEGGWTDVYKTDKLVLRRVYPGSFLMGSSSSEVGRTAASEYQHSVTLTKGYYLGVFEVSQRQWELVLGTRPSTINYDATYPSRPVETVSWNMIRGSELDSTNTLIGVLRGKSALDLDLPTEAQWEYACRAGTTTALYNGQNLTSTTTDTNLKKIARYRGTQSSGTVGSTVMKTAAIGSYASNDWGFYDMLGNVAEFCRDAYLANLGTAAAVDPYRSFASGSSHAVRGGYWYAYAQDCRSASRDSATASAMSQYYGARLSYGFGDGSLIDTKGDVLLQNRQIPVTVSLCHVLLDLGYGDKCLTVDRYEGQRLGEVPSVEREGYTCQGWFTENGELVTSEMVVSKDMVFYSRWEANSYHVNFDLNGGEGEAPSANVVYGATYGKLPTPTRTGYDFLGWFTVDGDAVAGETIVAIAAEHTLFAHWQVCTYIVRFDLNGGQQLDGSPSGKFTFGQAYGTLPSASREGYSFNGWYTAAEGGDLVESTTVEEIAGDHTLYAHWRMDISSGSDEDWNIVPSASLVYNGCEQSFVPRSVAFKNKTVTYTITGNAGIDAGSYTMTLVGAGDFIGEKSFVWNIAKRPLVLTSVSKTKSYDGTPLSTEPADVRAEGYAEGESFIYVPSCSITDVGSTNASFTVLDGTAKQANYDISYNFGTLTVTPHDLNDAMGLPDKALTVEAGSWLAIRAESEWFLKSDAVSEGEMSSIKLCLTNAAIVSFDFKVPNCAYGANDLNYMQVLVDGEEVGRYVEVVDWRHFSHDVTGLEQSHTVEIRYVCTLSSVDEGAEDAVYLKNITVWPHVLKTPNIEVETPYAAASTRVTLEGEEESTLYYRLDDGDACVYTGPFAVTGEVMICAWEGRNDYSDSAVVTQSVERAQYEIRFAAGDHGQFAEYTETQVLRWGDLPTAPSVVAADWFIFTGWSPSLSAASSNIVYTAQYALIEYALDFAGQSISYKYGDELKAPEPTTTNPLHTFVGWSYQGKTYAVGELLPYDGHDGTYVEVWQENRLSAPVITTPSFYEGESTMVSLSSETGSAIRYRLEGGETKVYTGPFVLSGSTVIHAWAVRDNYYDSEEAVLSVTRAPWTYGEYLDATNLTFETDLTRTNHMDATHSYVLTSGSLEAYVTNSLTTTVSGKGTYRLLIKYSVYGRYLSNSWRFDLISLYDNGQQVLQLGGEQDWTNVVYNVTGEGEHRLTLAYERGRFYNASTNFQNCVWIDTVKWSTDPLPELVSPTPAQVKNVLDKALDSHLAANITNGTVYADFRDWSGKVKVHGGTAAAGMEGVMAAPNAWLSYALGSETLIERMPTNGQMRIETFAPTAAPGKFDFTIGLEDIVVGSNASKENLKKVFGLEGGLTLGELSPTNVDITFGTPENGKVRFTAGPNEANAKADAFFMKVKVTP